MVITAALVKELRDRTSAGMMDCKKALEEAKGDIEAAIDFMRKSGVVKAAKKAGRVASEGMIAQAVSADHKKGLIIEINSETDFVARDQSFMQFASKVAEIALKQEIKEIAHLSETAFLDAETIEHARASLIAKIGENIQLRRLVFVSNSSGVVNTYVHSGRIGVLVELEGGNAELAKDIAMHIAAMRPEAVNSQAVPAHLIAKEREIFSAQAQESGKPAAVIEKMIEGRIGKYLKEVSLEDQIFVKDPSKTIADLLKQHAAKVISFTRFEVGEGIEKEVVNFADEVKSVLGGNG
jgi:elongation factor Ts